MVAGFPNLFTIAGTGSPAAFASVQMQGGSAPANARDPHAYSGGTTLSSGPYALAGGRGLRLGDEKDFATRWVNRLGMVHKEANQITLAPGQRGGIVWQFAKAGTVTYACLVPGHKEAGMVATVEVN